MSRAAVFVMLKGDVELTTICGANILAYQAVDTPPPGPFIVIKWDTMSPGVTWGRGARGVTMWVYDDPADYQRIEQMIERIKTLMQSATHVEGSDGYVLTTAKWTGDSEDLYDDAYGRILRQTSFDVLSRPAS